MSTENRHLSSRGRTETPGQHSTKLARSIYSGQIASKLRKLIIDGSLAEGTPLPESQLSKELSVSRGPIRQALHVLEGEGLVITRSNGRMVVAGFSVDDVRDLLNVRFELELRAATWGLDRGADPGGVAAAFAAIEAEGSSTSRLVDLDISFHRALVEFSGSRFLTRAWLTLAPVIHTVITVGNRRLAERDPRTDYARIVESHRDLLKAIEAADRGRLSDLLTRHFEFTRMFTPTAKRPA